jgi:hypothetical protein
MHVSVSACLGQSARGEEGAGGGDGVVCLWFWRPMCDCGKEGQPCV